MPETTDNPDIKSPPPILEAIQYNPAEFANLLAKCAKTQIDTVNAKVHLVFLLEYLDHLNAKTIVVEREYTDRHFLDDYAAYYVRCLDKYTSRCTRLHFFTECFDTERLKPSSVESRNETQQFLQECYLGFVVIKPLPQRFIGRTCLRTYPQDEPNHTTADVREYPVKRKYDVHIVGFDLYVESIAFQEQDHVVAACATSALWSAFHGTSELFKHAIPTPIEITRLATEHSPSDSRHLPNSGLVPYQMAEAIKHTGLEPELLGCTNEFIFKASLYAYLNMGLPVILTGALYDTSAMFEAKLPNGKTCSFPKFSGLHAVTVLGFRRRTDMAPQDEIPNTSLESSKMTTIYVHDDQVGPFARMKFCDAPLQTCDFRQGNITENSLVLNTSWMGENGKLDVVKFVPWTMLLPLYSKIRIRFIQILSEVLSLDLAVRAIINPINGNHDVKIDWNIFLSFSSDFKSDMRNASIDNDLKWKCIECATPRFIWRAIASVAGDPIIELIYDATDIEDSHDLLQWIIPHHKDLYRLLTDFAAESKLRGLADMVIKNLRQVFSEFHSSISWCSYLEKESYGI